MWELEDVIVDDGQKLEGTSDVKQWPLEVTVCDVSSEYSATHVRYSPRKSLERGQKHPLLLSLTGPLGVPCVVEPLRTSKELNSEASSRPPVPSPFKLCPPASEFEAGFQPSKERAD